MAARLTDVSGAEFPRSLCVALRLPTNPHQCREDPGRVRCRGGATVPGAGSRASKLPEVDQRVLVRRSVGRKKPGPGGSDVGLEAGGTPEAWERADDVRGSDSVDLVQFRLRLFEAIRWRGKMREPGGAA